MGQARLHQNCAIAPPCRQSPRSAKPRKEATPRHAHRPRTPLSAGCHTHARSSPAVSTLAKDIPPPPPTPQALVRQTRAPTTGRLCRAHQIKTKTGTFSKVSLQWLHTVNILGLWLFRTSACARRLPTEATKDPHGLLAGLWCRAAEVLAAAG
jgi:hypothetical protein